jgi:putative transposase
MTSNGYRKITRELRIKGYEINHKKVLRIMRDMRIQAIYPKPKTTVINQEHKKYPYLLRDLLIDHPNQVWASDITYVKLLQGFVYLVAIIDLHSRYIVGWTLSNTMEADVCAELLQNTLNRGVKPDIINTDQGVQFTSDAWITTAENNNILVSMDGIKRWADNIIIERYWRTIKYEHILLHDYSSMKEARQSIGEYIEKYNNRRLHQSLQYKTPAMVYFGSQYNNAKLDLIFH